MGWYCVHLLEAGGRIAYAGSSGRMEERLRRHFRGYSSAAGRGLRPDATYVLACTRSRSLALAWEAWLHKAYRPPYAARAPAKRPRKPPHQPPGGTPPAPRSASPDLQVPYRYKPVSLHLWESIYVCRGGLRGEVKLLQFIMHCGIYHGHGYRQDKGWIYIKLATDDGFRAAAKQNKKGITVEGVVMHLRLVSGRGGSLLAEHYTRDPEKTHAAADKLKAVGLRPNVARSGPNYVVYIATADLLRLAERDGEIRKATALYLAEKAENGTPRQREIAEKILQRHPFLNPGLPLLQNQ